jgi:hypothetical protein
MNAGLFSLVMELLAEYLALRRKGVSLCSPALALLLVLLWYVRDRRVSLGVGVEIHAPARNTIIDVCTLLSRACAAASRGAV